MVAKYVFKKWNTNQHYIDLITVVLNSQILIEITDDFMILHVLAKF